MYTCDTLSNNSLQVVIPWTAAAVNMHSRTVFLPHGTSWPHAQLCVVIHTWLNVETALYNGMCINTGLTLSAMIETYKVKM